MTIVWIEKYIEFHSVHAVHPLAAKEPDWSTTNFILNIIEQEEDGFNFNYFLAAIAFCYWLRVLFMLKITGFLGPLIAIVLSMIRDLTSFGTLYAISCLTWASLGLLMFPKLPEFYDLFNVTFLVFRISNGNWDHTVFDALGDEYYLGYIWLGAAILTNMLIIVTVLIAMFSDTYVKFTEQKQGLYYSCIISHMPMYKTD
mmetsp:Transcript_56426/g.77737  ORF Transcript_56426/g.77737 Transcript_56426/m.77737 type:complete len:200 (+) Transcript_56426:330-929(+)